MLLLSIRVKHYVVVFSERERYLYKENDIMQCTFPIVITPLNIRRTMSRNHLQRKCNIKKQQQKQQQQQQEQQKHCYTGYMK